MLYISGSINPLDTMMENIQRDSLYGKLDWLSVVQPTEVQSLTNLMNSSDIAINTGACAFVANRGFTTVPTTKYINTGKNLNGAKATHNNCHLWVYLRTNTGGVSFEGLGGCITPTRAFYTGVDTTTAPDTLDAAFSSAAFNTTILANLPTSFIGCSRTASNVLHSRIKTTVATITTPVNLIGITTSISMMIGALNNNGTVTAGIPAQIAGWGWGSGLSSTELGLLYSHIQTYMTAIGAEV
jgi:hypothetical protein